MRLDRDAPLPLQIHRVEQLILLIPLFNGPGRLEQPIRQRGLAVIDMRDDAKITSKPASHVEAHYCLVTGRRQSTYRRIGMSAWQGCAPARPALNVWKRPFADYA